jgi:hypothetical protein
LVGEFGGQAAGGTKLSLAHGELASFFHGAAVAFEQNLEGVTSKES